jgi:hypothetical protein
MNIRGWLSNRAPAGYLRGSLLSKLRHDLKDFECEAVSDVCMQFRASRQEIEFRAEEQVEPQFLMHVVTTRFSLRIPGNTPGERRLKIRHRGALKRIGIECMPVEGDDEEGRRLAKRLSDDAELATALLPLDFTHCELHQHDAGWDAIIVHFGASEVVYRFPPLRQYVRLAPPQLDALLQTFASLRRLLEQGGGSRQGFDS